MPADRGAERPSVSITTELAGTAPIGLEIQDERREHFLCGLDGDCSFATLLSALFAAILCKVDGS